MLMLLVLSAFKRSLVKGVPVKNGIALPDWLRLGIALNLCKTYGILIYLKSMVKNRKFLGRCDSCFPSARLSIHNT
jgi:hypothetical protein